MNLLRHTGPAPQIIEAKTDEQAVAGWLNEYADTENTYNAYAKEATRLLMFLKLYRLTLNTLRRPDVDTFKRFLQNPPQELIGPPKPRKHPDWKPFAAPLSETGLRYALRATRNLMGYLQNAGYVERNPFALMREKRHSDTTMQERYLDSAAWEVVKKALRKMPEADHTQVAKKIRARWVVSFLYLTGARRSEAAAAEMSDFRLAGGRWWWYVTGKGGKRAQVPASDELLRELMLYRRHLGLMTLPTSDEPYPAILPLPTASGEFSNRFLSDKRISAIAADVFKFAAEFATSEGQRRMLLNATAHWIRHTSATHQIELGLPVQHVSAILRHSKIDTTLRYVHQDRHEQHDRQQSFKINMGDTNEDVPGTSDPTDPETA
jgi:integrase